MTMPMFAKSQNIYLYAIDAIDGIPLIVEIVLITCRLAKKTDLLHKILTTT